MQGCLGIYVQKNLIKYAKVSKDRNSFKVEAYGVKFYDGDIEKTIEQIVKETYSFQVPISINIDNEKYTYSNVFALLKAQDLEKAMDTEFEFFCNNNNQNKNTLEYRKIYAPDKDDRDKLRVLYTYVDKSNVVQRLQILDKFKIQNVSPIAITIPNLNPVLIQEDCLIVNLEDETEVTTVINGKVFSVDKIETGMGKILRLIEERENSIQKAYEICKNTTVYTKSGQNLKVEGNEYLDDIITILFEIINQIKDIVAKNGVDVTSIYLTGMGLVINNIDLLFQEAWIDKKCEILVPYFIEKTNVKINIKDYIEVNSAISLAIQGLDSKKQNINFDESKMNFQKIMAILTSDVGKKNSNTKIKGRKSSTFNRASLREIANMELDFGDRTLLTIVAGLMIAIILFVGVTEVLSKQIKEKMASADTIIENSQKEIDKVTKYNSLVNARTSEYQKLVDKIDEANSKVSEEYSSKNAIPNLLNKIMYNIPVGVQLLSIENQSGKDIVITAQAEKYDQLGYFKAALEEEGILTDIISTRGTKPGELISITITGKLPY
jgi:hypothetical protein